MTAGRLMLAGVALAVAAMGCNGRAGSQGAYHAGSIRVERVVAPAPAAVGDLATTTMAVYATIRNDGEEPDALTGVSSSAARESALHGAMGHGGGMAGMAPIGELVVPARGSVSLAPGGAHAMLTGLSRLPAPGDSVPVTLAFSRGGSVTTWARVVPYADLERALGSGS